MGRPLTSLSPTSPRSHPPAAALPDTGTPAPPKIQQNPWMADLCNDGLEQPPPPTHQQKHRVPRLPGKPFAELLSHPQSASESPPVPTSLFLIAIKRHQPSPALVQHWYRHAGEENLRAALQHKSAVPPLNTYRWIHQTLQKS